MDGLGHAASEAAAHLGHEVGGEDVLGLEIVVDSIQHCGIQHWFGA